MAEKNARELVEVLGKIPLLRGLSPTQVRLVVGQCMSKRFQAGDIICQQGRPSDAMYILVSGKLAIVTKKDLRVATIDPVTTVGEMGVITGQSRSATVEALKDSSVLVIQKPKFDMILRGHRELKAKVLENIVIMLADKLVRDNVRMRDFLSAQTNFEDSSQKLELRLGAAVDLLVERGMERDEADAQIEERTRVNTPRILVVDDEPVVRKLVTRGLSQYQITEASNGVEALAAIEVQKPDLVLTDIQMPEMDGLELLKRIRDLGIDVEVVAISASMSVAEIAKHPFCAVVEKPVMIQGLRELVENLLADDRESK